MFKKGDIVKINPNATTEDFKLNYCTIRFMERLSEKFEVLAVSEYDKGGKEEKCYRLKIPNSCSWYVLERCLILATEENEL